VKYIDDHLPLLCAEKIARLEPCPVTGGVDINAILITLCTTLDVWPRSSRPDDEPVMVRLIRNGD
jgi:hypothetical protein